MARRQPEDRRGEVGDGLGSPNPHHPVEPPHVARPRRASAAPPHVRVDQGSHEQRLLAVHARRERFADGVASHGWVVARLGPVVPARHTLRVDELTRLALAAGAGDRCAAVDLVRRTQPEVWRVCARLGDHDAADDLTQEVYLRALPALAAFRGDASARTWLLQIARYVCADHVRARTRGRTLAERLHRQERTETPVSANHDGEVDLEDLVARLARDRREAFVLTQVAGLSYAEAALACEVPIGTIRSRVARARADLLRLLHVDREADTGT
jgi:RNA polymerase sigma-70 factor (ECF subfamily)